MTAIKTITSKELKAEGRKLRRKAHIIKAHPCVRDISDERATENGFWIYLHDGWVCPNSEGNAISEDTIKEAVKCLKGITYDPSTLDGEPVIALA